MIQYARLPAIVTLLLVLGPGAVYLYSRQSDATSANSSQLDELRAKIAGKDPKPSDWFAYAQTLQNLKRYDQAAWAYQRVLELEDGNVDARLQGAICTALTNDKTETAAYMRQMNTKNPRLAKEVFTRPELQPYMADNEFQELQKIAIAQSMD